MFFDLYFDRLGCDVLVIWDFKVKLYVVLDEYVIMRIFEVFVF